jgi:hypothetical protein
LLIALLLNGGMAVANPTPQLRTQPNPQGTTSSSSFTDWHDGTNQSTPEVDLTYVVDYYSGWISGDNETHEHIAESLQFSYKDDTEAKLWFTFLYAFKQGGVDIANQQVLNWTKLIAIDLRISTQTYVNGTVLGTSYSPDGSKICIIPGTAKDLNITWDWNNPGYHRMGSWIGTISWQKAPFSIGAVSLSTLDYTYNGTALKESIATFNITTNASLCNYEWAPTGPTSSSVELPVVFMFQVRHNATRTQYKYGEDIDWSKNKAFPTASPMATGANFTIVAATRMSFRYGMYGHTVKQFSTDAGNSSGIFRYNNTELGQLKVPTQYALKGNMQVHNTTRTFMENNTYTSLDNQSSSAIYVCFDGFKYNESTGFIFDPVFIFNNEPAPRSNNGPGSPVGATILVQGATILIAIALAGVSVLVMRKRRSPTIGKLLPFF